jgi:hypothetical protein
VINFDYSAIDAKLDSSRTRNFTLDDVYSETPKVYFSWIKKRNRTKKRFPPIILDAIIEKLSWFNNSEPGIRIKSIHGATEVELLSQPKEEQRSFIRAHPDFRQTGLWFDWVNVQWETEPPSNRDILIPAQVLMLLDFDTIVYEDIFWDAL